MKLTHALASGSLLSLGSAIEPRRVTRNLRHIQNESAKGKNDVERLLFDAGSMSMAATVGNDEDGILMGGAKSGKSQKKGDMDFFFVGHEECVDANFNRYESIAYVGIEDEDACQDKCRVFDGNDELIGLEYTPAAEWCMCLFDGGFVEDLVEKEGCPTEAVCSTCPVGEGQVMGTEIGSVVLDGGPRCYRYGPPGLKPSSFTDFNKDGSFCLSSTGREYDFIARLNIETTAEIERSEGSPILSSPYPFDSPQECAVECLKAGLVNFVGLNYLKEAVKVDPSCLECTDPGCGKCEPVPDGSLDLMAHYCFCLLPDGAADCSGYPNDAFNACCACGEETGPVAFAADKETYASLASGPGYTITDGSCTRNDNFDPTEPTLGAKFPGQHSKSGKVSKSGSKVSKVFSKFLADYEY